MSASVARRRALLCALLAIFAGAGSALAAPCDLLGGDGDGDGICDDGNGSGVVGDAPCSCQPGSPPSCAANCDDNCPWSANPDQLDVGRLGAPDLPDGIGDACQCFDVSNDGRGNVLDSVVYRRAVTSHPPPLAAPQKCLGAGAATCDAGDVAPLRNALALLPPAPANVCAAAGACTASADCPAGISCNLGAQRCEKNLGQACVQNGQCLSDGCCGQRCADLANDTANCGGCGLACTNPHGTTACVSGACAPTCAFGFAHCNGPLQIGCETDLSDCLVNGCMPLALGSFVADGSGCAAAPMVTGGVSEGSAGVTFRENDSLGCAPTSGLIELVVPVGVDYDLVVTAPAGVTCTHWDGSAYVAGCSGSNRGSQVERIRLVSPEFCVLGVGDPVSQTFSATATVHYVAGASCQPWQFAVSAGSGC
jgi:hypothetical protein